MDKGERGGTKKDYQRSERIKRRKTLARKCGHTKRRIYKRMFATRHTWRTPTIVQ
jgi:hypothetical protein